MQTRVDPPIDAWADTLSRCDAVVATGHQASLWHPGILAKLMAMHLAAERFGCAAKYLVVDHDVHDVSTLDLPHVENKTLSVQRVQLIEQALDVPTGFQPAATINVKAIPAGRLRDALEVASGNTLAQQMTDAVMRWIEPVLGRVEVMYVSAMSQDAAYGDLIERIVNDARVCAQAYNRAIEATRVRDVAMLRIEPNRVELPVWACAWKQPRQRVFVDLADRKPWLVFDDGEPIDRDQWKLLPKALLLSAVMRSLYSDLFIHGLGGEIYDQATEHWWQHWHTKPLAPMATATADVRLDFDVPSATSDQVQRAIWAHHHARHTFPGKQHWLNRINATDDPAQRSALFQQMHQFLAEQRIAHPQPIAQAEANLAKAQLVLHNTQLARRRDWCVGLYPIAQLQKLYNTPPRNPRPRNHPCECFRGYNAQMKHSLSIVFCLLTFLTSTVAFAAKPAGELTFERWYVVMMDDQRVGYMHASEHASDQHITTEESMKLGLRRGPLTVYMEQSMQFVETVEGKPVAATTMLKAAQSPMRSRFTFNDQGITVERNMSGRIVKQQLAPMPGDYYTPAAGQRYVQQQTEAGEKTINLSILDVSSGSPTVVAMSMQHTSDENVEVLGKTVPAQVWEVTSAAMAGVVVRQYVDDQGKMLRMTLNLMGMSLEVLAADEQLARSPINPPEIVASTLVRPSKPIPQPRQTTEAVYRLTLPATFDGDLPRSGYQRITWADEQTALVAINLNQPVNPTGDEADARYLANTTMLDHEHETIRTFVADTFDNDADSLTDTQKAERLRAKVHQFVTSKNLSVGFASATEVARTAQGDCTEHAVLLAAALRAADIPSRTVTGLIYVEGFLGQNNVFGYHMWTQAWLTPPGSSAPGISDGEISGGSGTTNSDGSHTSGGASGGRWVDLDATLDQPFDAAHIALATSAMGEGALANDMVQLLPLFSALKIDVVEIARD